MRPTVLLLFALLAIILVSDVLGKKRGKGGRHKGKHGKLEEGKPCTWDNAMSVCVGTGYTGQCVGKLCECEPDYVQLGEECQPNPEDGPEAGTYHTSERHSRTQQFGYDEDGEHNTVHEGEGTHVSVQKSRQEAFGYGAGTPEGESEEDSYEGDGQSLTAEETNMGTPCAKRNRTRACNEEGHTGKCKKKQCVCQRGYVQRHKSCAREDVVDPGQLVEGTGVEDFMGDTRCQRICRQNTPMEDMAAQFGCDCRRYQ